MPEGPSIVILKELLLPFKGRKVTAASGYAKIDQAKPVGQKLVDIKSWGKHTLLCFKGFTIRIHLMMFGSYRINEEKEGKNPTLRLEFAKGERINFYTCAVKMIEEDLDEVYDWKADIMSDAWSAANAKKKLKEHPDMLACDALMDQTIFSGCGNIIKNEVLFRTRIHPLSLVASLPPKQLKLLIGETRNYAFDFLEWKKQYELKKHWLIYTKKTCPRDHVPVIKEYMGNGKRRTFYCTTCQVLYNDK